MSAASRRGIRAPAAWLPWLWGLLRITLLWLMLIAPVLAQRPDALPAGRDAVAKFVTAMTHPFDPAAVARKAR